MRPCEDLWGTCLCAKSGFPIPLPKTSWDKNIFSCNLQRAPDGQRNGVSFSPSIRGALPFRTLRRIKKDAVLRCKERRSCYLYSSVSGTGQG